jgi:hypothetical protein
LRASAASGQTSDWGEPWKFTIIKAAASETLTASDWQVEQVAGNVYLVSGRTQAGATCPHRRARRFRFRRRFISSASFRRLAKRNSRNQRRARQPQPLRIESKFGKSGKAITDSEFRI